MHIFYLGYRVLVHLTLSDLQTENRRDTNGKNDSVCLLDWNIYIKRHFFEEGKEGKGGKGDM